jgi:hypothetical protein
MHATHPWALVVVMAEEEDLLIVSCLVPILLTTQPSLQPLQHSTCSRHGSLLLHCLAIVVAHVADEKQRRAERVSIGHTCPDLNHCQGTPILMVASMPDNFKRSCNVWWWQSSNSDIMSCHLQDAPCTGCLLARQQQADGTAATQVHVAPAQQRTTHATCHALCPNLNLRY